MTGQTKNARPDEFALIERHFAPLASKGAFGLRDDAALLGESVFPQVITQDALAADVHFFSTDPADMVARKAIRVNLSDLAAKGAVPVALSLALGLPDDWSEDWIAAFARGLGEECRRHDLAMTGGDTFRSPGGTVIAVTALGEVREGRYRSRLGAGEGDYLFVTGTIGDAALGLVARKAMLGRGKAIQGLDREQVEVLQSRYLLPDPPVKYCGAIARHASASMDISDGLAGDLEKLATASGFDVQVEASRVPLSAEIALLAQDSSILQVALTGGDDYQILFTAPPENVEPLRIAANEAGIRLSQLGTIRAGTGKVTFLDAHSEVMPLARKSWNHFA